MRDRAATLGNTLTVVTLAILWLALLAPTGAQADKAGGGQIGNEQELMRQVAEGELRAQHQDHSLWRYKQMKMESGKTIVCEVVETDHASLYRVVSINGDPLGPEEARKEDARVKKLLSNPRELQNEQRKEEHDVQLERRLLQMLPEAFHYHYAGREGRLTKLDFTPDPGFHSMQREAEVFHHMAGSIWVDAQQKRIARIDGHLVSEVKFGGGILGHLAEGGTFFIEQQEVGGGRWRLTRLDVNMNGKALFFKSISVHQKEQDSDFKRVPAGITVLQASQLLSNGMKSQAASAAERAGGN